MSLCSFSPSLPNDTTDLGLRIELWESGTHGPDTDTYTDQCDDAENPETGRAKASNWFGQRYKSRMTEGRCFQQMVLEQLDITSQKK